jgi:hypothetical protein
MCPGHVDDGAETPNDGLSLAGMSLSARASQSEQGSHRIGEPCSTNSESCLDDCLGQLLGRVNDEQPGMSWDNSRTHTRDKKSLTLDVSYSLTRSRQSHVRVSLHVTKGGHATASNVIAKRVLAVLGS